MNYFSPIQLTLLLLCQSHRFFSVTSSLSIVGFLFLRVCCVPCRIYPNEAHNSTGLKSNNNKSQTLGIQLQCWASMTMCSVCQSVCVIDLWPRPRPPLRLSLDSESDSSDGSHRPSRDPAPPPQKHSSSNNKVSHTDLSFHCPFSSTYRQRLE